MSSIEDYLLLISVAAGECGSGQGIRWVLIEGGMRQVMEGGGYRVRNAALWSLDFSGISVVRILDID